jgi:hypothetical protein
MDFQFYIVLILLYYFFIIILALDRNFFFRMRKTAKQNFNTPFYFEVIYLIFSKSNSLYCLFDFSKALQINDTDLISEKENKNRISKFKELYNLFYFLQKLAISIRFLLHFSHTYIEQKQNVQKGNKIC